MKERQTTLIPKSTKRVKNPKNREKKELRSWWKKYKCGMVKLEDMPPKIQNLLKKYYPVK